MNVVRGVWVLSGETGLLLKQESDLIFRQGSRGQHCGEEDWCRASTVTASTGVFDRGCRSELTLDGGLEGRVAVDVTLSQTTLLCFFTPLAHTCDREQAVHMEDTFQMFNLDTMTYGHKKSISFCSEECPDSQGKSAERSLCLLASNHHPGAVFDAGGRSISIDTEGSEVLISQQTREVQSLPARHYGQEDMLSNQRPWSSPQLMVSGTQCAILPHDHSKRDSHGGTWFLVVIQSHI